MMRKSILASGLVVALAALFLGATPETASACHRSRCCGYSSCRSSCYSSCTTCYVPSSCNTCYVPCAPACTTCAPACSTCYVPSSCCGGGYSYSYRSSYAPAYVTYGGQPGYYVAAPSTPVVVQRSNVNVIPVRYEARRTSLFGW